MKVLIAPSILSADIHSLQSEVASIEDYSDLLHIDIMDGLFVPPTTFLASTIGKIKTKLPKDVHLMVKDPVKSIIDDFAKAGASIITFHLEACNDIYKAIQKIRSLGVKVGISINPATPVEGLFQYVEKIDQVLIMSVNPGYAGQKFIPDVLGKIRILRKKFPNLDIEIDGGINDQTVQQAVGAGANILVAGSAIFEKKDRKLAIARLRELAVC